MQPYKRVLVVDDEAPILKMLSRVLEKGGYIVVTANDGEQAMQTMREYWPDVLVLDVMMPKLNGYRVSRMVKLLAEKNGNLKPPKILLVTSRNLSESPDREQSMSLFSMADDVLYKPFSPNELLGKVKALNP
jgi:DNA-binding response OmpR family regulator